MHTDIIHFYWYLILLADTLSPAATSYVATLSRVQRKRANPGVSVITFTSDLKEFYTC